jgi:hypothetical protein
VAWDAVPEPMVEYIDPGFAARSFFWILLSPNLKDFMLFVAVN